jgi:hypothetical protein
MGPLTAKTGYGTFLAQWSLPVLLLGACLLITEPENAITATRDGRIALPSSAVEQRLRLRTRGVILVLIWSRALRPARRSFRRALFIASAVWLVRSRVTQWAVGELLPARRVIIRYPRNNPAYRRVTGLCP